MMQRMNDLAVQYNSGIQNDQSKDALEAEFTALTDEITRITENAKFNGVTLFGGTDDLTFQVGYDSADVITVGSSALASVDVSAVFITDSSSVQAAIGTVSAQRAELGAVQNRFEHTINSLNVAIENLSASESRIRDTDMAQEMVAFTRSQILSQAGTAMLAQANQASQGVLQLLR
jgi:flagellin